MAREITLTPNRTYKTKANLEKAVAEVLTRYEVLVPKQQRLELRYLVLHTADGRLYPAFIGREAVEAGIHFHFVVIA